MFGQGQQQQEKDRQRGTGQAILQRMHLDLAQSLGEEHRPEYQHQQQQGVLHGSIRFDVTIHRIHQAYAKHCSLQAFAVAHLWFTPRQCLQ